MPDMEKVIKGLKAARLFFEMGSNRTDGAVGKLGCKDGVKYIDDAIALLKEQQNQIWELQDQVEYLTDKQKEQETELCDRCGRRRLKSTCEGR